MNDEKGVCCGSNGSVCCPNDYDCDEQQLSCQLRDEKSIFLRNLLTVEDFNQCQTSNILCSNEQTCCSTNTDSFACCPYPNVNYLLFKFKGYNIYICLGWMLCWWRTLLSKWNNM